jgi:hypothetical protein
MSPSKMRNAIPSAPYSGSKTLEIGVL